MAMPNEPHTGEADTSNVAATVPPQSLSGIELLSAAPPHIRERLAEECTWSSYADRDVIIDQEDKTTDVYFIVQGSVRIVDQVDADQQLALIDLGAGKCFGEFSALDHKERSARVTATDDTVLASLSSEAFVNLLLECPAIAVALLRQLAGYVRTLDSRFSAVSTKSAQQRVYAELIKMCEPDVEREGRWVIPQFPGHGEIASWVGTKRDVVAEAIGQLARSGIVERKHRMLRINDHARLKRLATQH